MANADLVVGLQAGRLNSAIAQVYARPDIKSRLFRGSGDMSRDGVSVKVAWELSSAPQLAFRAPTTAEWNVSVAANGRKPRQISDTFIVTLPNLKIKFTDRVSSKNRNVSLRLICRAKTLHRSASLEALAVIVDKNNFSDWDNFFWTMKVFPQIIKDGNTILSGFRIPAPSIPGVSLTAPTVDIVGNALVLSFNLSNQGQASIAGLSIPNKSFFTLLSQELAQRAINHVVTKDIQGESFSKSGNGPSFLGFKGGYRANARVDRINVKTTNNPLRLNCGVEIGMSASASVDTPVDEIVDAINPSKW